MDKSRYQEVGTGKTWPTKENPLKVGDSIEGRYIDKRVEQGPNKSNLYALEQNGGEIVWVWGSTVIDRKFDSIAKGKMVAIEYLGTKKSEKRGGSDYKDFWVGSGIMVVGDEPAL